MAGYHNNFILKHANSSVHKLKEEVEEFIDAVAAGNTIMAQQELSDVYLKLHHLIRDYGLSMDDLKVMADTTERVFESGCRKESSLFDIIKHNVQSISINDNTTSIIHLLCYDENYRYLFHYHDDNVNFLTNQHIEYIEVVKGTIYSHLDNKSYNEGQLIQNFDRYISIHENSIILVKQKFSQYETANFRSANDDKSDAQFDLLKRVIEDDF